MSFVKYHILKPIPLKYFVVLQDQFLTSDDYMHRVGFGPAQALGLALLDAALVVDDLEGRTPLLDLHFPLVHDCGGHHDQMRTPNPLRACQVG